MEVNLNKNKEKKELKPSRHSKKFFIITIAVIVLALGGTGAFAFKTWQVKEAKKKQELIKKEQERIALEKAKKEAEEAAAKKKAEEARLAEAEKIKKEVAEIDVSEIKAAVADLKAAMGAFKK